MATSYVHAKVITPILKFMFGLMMMGIDYVCTTSITTTLKNIGNILIMLTIKNKIFYVLLIILSMMLITSNMFQNLIEYYLVKYHIDNDAEDLGNLVISIFNIIFFIVCMIF